MLKKPSIRRYSPRSYNEERPPKDKGEPLSESDVSFEEEEDVKLINSMERTWNRSQLQDDDVPRRNRRIKQARRSHSENITDFKRKGRPKLMDLISSLSQSNVEVEIKEKDSKKIDNFFPYVPSEDITLTTDEESSKKDGTAKNKPTNQSKPEQQQLENPPTSKKEFKKKQSSISLELILKEDTVDPLLEDSVIPIVKDKVENQILLKNSSQENQEVKPDGVDNPEKINAKEVVVEKEDEDNQKKDVVNEAEQPMFSKINIGDEPKKTASKPVNTGKKESKNVDNPDLRDDDKRVSSAGSSSSSSSGELYVGDTSQYEYYW